MPVTTHRRIRGRRKDATYLAMRPIPKTGTLCGEDVTEFDVSYHQKTSEWTNRSGVVHVPCSLCEEIKARA